MRSLLLLTAALLSTAVQAHITMVKPAPINYKGNKYTTSPNYNYASPLAADGSDYPCKAYNKLLGAPEGTPVETWAAGSVQTFTIGDGSGAVHGGGSCQASISEDGGVTFKVVKSFTGNCPVQKHSYSFTVPAETKTGKVLFAWTWFNKIGNREMYMNCAAITITGGGAGLSAYPDIFTANIGGPCSVPEGRDVVFPNPGKDVDTAPGGAVSLGPPVGKCGPVGTPKAAPVSSSVTSASSLPTTPPTPSLQTGGCMCSCGGANGYIVNILPAGPGGIAGMTPSPSAPSTTPNTSKVKGIVDTTPTRNSSKVYRYRRDF